MSHITSCVVEVRVSRLPPHGSCHGSATTVTHRLYTLTFNRCHIVVDTLPHIIYHICHQQTLNVVTKWQLSQFPIAQILARIWIIYILSNFLVRSKYYGSFPLKVFFGQRLSLKYKAVVCFFLVKNSKNKIFVIIEFYCMVMLWAFLLESLSCFYGNQV